MLYPDLEEDDDNDDNADEDYDVSSESDDDNNPNNEENAISTLFLDIGSREQIDDLIKLDTISLLDWNDAMTDLQLGMASRYDFKIYFETNIASCCQQSRDPRLEGHPRSASITSDRLYVQEGMVCSKICSRKGIRQLGDNFFNSTKISPNNARFKCRNYVQVLASQNEHSSGLCFQISFLLSAGDLCDSTHLRGPYKDVQLVASTWYAK
ncbi:hypothetical protein M9H77_27972 [Catharanthus roseus]|uniref:Uncharacterized protein n=1 Tax=Catharanthus roseus TaxID=4058 RepID=A0ACC0AEX0_CATRO|nr:hypothetical protein M9H77_27972 [Catharanthus roseus]